MRAKTFSIQLKRFTAIFTLMLLVFTAVFAGVDMTFAHADDGPVLKLHYHRPDGNYTDWDAWLWEYGHDGAAYPFVNEGGDMVATMNVSAGVTSVGFIVRTSSWSKDVNQDQFIDITEVLSGTVDVYVESGVEGYTMSYGEGAKVGIKVSNATYDGGTTVTVKMTNEIEDYETAFTLKGTAGEIAISSVENLGNAKYALGIASELDSTSNYKLNYDGNDYNVVLPNIYSTPAFEERFTYTGNDLGATWNKDETVFRLWAPTAEEANVNLYESGDTNAGDLLESITMTKSDNGTWVATAKGDKNGVYYTYSVLVNGAMVEAVDPYARTTGINGNRGMIIDLNSTNPEGWDKDTNPHAGENITDAIIYEGHIRDLTTGSDVGIKKKGKFLGLTEKGTKSTTGVSTGLDHMIDLGITHLHVLPMYDFGSVDESSPINKYNWGYDPQNFNVPEGSYATDAKNGAVRVAELKTMVKTLHDNNISVVMDVVYNHVHSASDFCFNVLVPGYFSRINDNGSYSNGSGCGNDTASERSMVRKYIVDSVNYWADEYHIDGFRFDLVGLLDTDTINEIVETVHEKHPDVIFYGEGWSLTTAVTKADVKLAVQTNSTETPGFAYFNDTIRDGLKGSVFNKSAGFVSGSAGDKPKIECCLLGADNWCKSPSQTVNYASCHDNNTLFDRLQLSCPKDELSDIIKMNNLAAAIYMSSQGVPFMQAGEEMLRTKINSDGTFNENSYNAGDTVNSMKWANLAEDTYSAVYEYYKGLIAFRKAHSALRLTTAAEVEQYMSIVRNDDHDMVTATIVGGPESETAEAIYMIFNRGNESKTVTLPEGEWNIYVNGEKAGTESLGSVSGTVNVEPISAMILAKGVKVEDNNTTDTIVNNGNTEEPEKDIPSSDAAGASGDGSASSESATAGAGTESASDKGMSGKGLAAVLITAALAGVVTVVLKRRQK